MISNRVKDFLRVLLFPFVMLRRLYFHVRNIWLAKHNPMKLAGLNYRAVMGQDMDWSNPIDLNAKIQWLKFYGDKELWARCADKYEVRKYVEERGLKDILVELYGKWDRVEDIDWSKLPNKFVVKTNNDSGGVYICKEKEGFNIPSISRELNKRLHSSYSGIFVEPHYSLIKPCIIAEELLDNTKQDIPSTSLIDYKVWAFNGEPAYIRVYYDRVNAHARIATYDTKWNFRPDVCVKDSVFGAPEDVIPRPLCLDKLLEYASILSKGHPEVRVDFYIIGGKCYFGEMTFTSSGGYMGSLSHDALIELGNKTDLSIIRRNDVR